MSFDGHLVCECVHASTISAYSLLGAFNPVKAHILMCAGRPEPADWLGYDLPTNTSCNVEEIISMTTETNAN